MVTIKNGTRHSFVPTAWAHSQIATYAEIPREYYNRLLDENEPLLRDNVNHGFTKAMERSSLKRGNTGRLLRTYKGKARALLSSRYRRLDNFDLFEAIAPSLMELDFSPVSCEITDKRLYIKVLSEKIKGEIKVGDPVQYGLVVSGSDVGCGSVKVEVMIYRLVCRNGMICEAGIDQRHIGRNQAGTNIEELLSDTTKEISDIAFWNEVRDVVRGMARHEVFEGELNKIRAAEGMPITLFNLPILVSRAAKAIGGINLSEGVKTSILDNLANGAHGAGLNKWGLANAYTFGAQHESLDYDDATELERAGSKILSLSDKAWAMINARPTAEEKAAA
jgi:hypothetical protein